MNKIKVIDLLNMISKGEELPKRIKYKYDYEDEMHIFKLNEDNLYIEQYDDRLLDFIYPDFRNLNDTVEIIEEQEEIDKLEIDENGYIDTNNGSWKGRKLDVEFAKAINKLAEAIKNIKEK